jgi:flagellar biosynthesis component FlhA
VIAIEPELERLLVQALGNANGAALDPGVADILTRSAAEVARKQEDMGMPACLLVPDRSAFAMARLLRAPPRACRCWRTARFLKRIRSASGRSSSEVPAA